MALSGGGNRSELRPMDPQGTTLGSHKGAYEALNVRNAKPGFNYVFAKLSASAILVKQNQGWQLVKENDPEEWGVPRDMFPDKIQGSLDSLKAFGDVVLMRIPNERYQEIQDEHNARSVAALGGTESEFLGKGDELGEEVGSSTQGRPLHYMQGQHGTFIGKEPKS